jgi:aquaporin Z
MQIRKEKSARKILRDEFRIVFAEFVGTFMLTFVAAGAVVVSETTDRTLSMFGRAFIPGLLILALIYSIGDISGAHVNPGVSLAFFLRGVFAWYRLFLYWIAQFAGAIAAAAYLALLFGNVHALGATIPKIEYRPTVSMFGLETMLSIILYFVILNTSTGHQLMGHNAGVAVGFTVAMLGVLGDPLGGGSMNCARSYGPAFVSGNLTRQWIFVAASVIAAVLVNVIIYLLRGKPVPHEVQAAEGIKGQHAESRERDHPTLRHCEPDAADPESSAGSRGAKPQV